MDNPNLKEVYLSVNNGKFREAFEELTELLESSGGTVSSSSAELYLMILRNFCDELERKEQLHEMFECYGKALELCPEQRGRICDEMASKLVR